MNAFEIIEKLKKFDEMIANPSKKFTFENAKRVYPSITKITFNRDIKTLKDIVNQRYKKLSEFYNEKLLIFDTKSKTYSYVVPTIRAFDDLNNEESKKLIEVISTVTQLFPENEGLIQKIIAKINVKNPSSIHWDPLQLIFDGKRFGFQYLKILTDAIVSRQPIEITTINASRTKNYKILPVLLKEYHNGWYASWYILGMELEKNNHLVTHVKTKSLRCFSLEKITQINPINHKGKIEIKPDFNPSDYFKNILGVWRKNLEGEPHDPPLIDVQFKINKDSWIKNYLPSHPIHFTQNLIEETDGSIKGFIKVEDTLDLVNLFLRYADQFTVIEPVKLRETIRTKLQESLDKYH